MKRVFERKNPEKVLSEEKLIEIIKIGITGCGMKSGTSFIGTSIAYICANKTDRSVSYVQLDSGTEIYDAIGIDKRFAGREFVDYYWHIGNGNSIKEFRNMDEKINWSLRIPDSTKKRVHKKLSCDESECDTDELSLVHYMRLINNISGNVIVCDFGGAEDHDLKELYEDMDVIVCVIDPLPSKLLENKTKLSLIKSLETKGKKIIWSINKDNAGLNRRELRDFIGNNVIDDSITIPLIDERLFYSCEYNCELPVSNKDIVRIIENSIDDIIRRCFN